MNEIEAEGGEAIAHYGDVTDLDYTQQLIEDAVAEYGAVHNITNFAGILRDRMVFNMTEEEWDAVIDVHLKGHFALIRNAAAHWRERFKEEEYEKQRSFTGVTSGAAFGSAGQPNYAAAKAGVLGLIRSTGQSLYQYNVRSNAVMPAATLTRMTESIPEEHRPDMTEDTHGPHLVTPAAAFYASDDATGVNGTTVRIGAGGVVGYVSNPSVQREFRKELPADTYTRGWTPQELAEEWDALTEGYDTNIAPEWLR